jgi:hypothetical protein
MDVRIKWACATMASWYGVGYDDACNGVETHGDTGKFKEP